MDPKSLLLEEYKLAQTVINHYERLIWYIGSVLNASVVLLAGYLLNSGKSKYLWFAFLVSALFSTIWYLFERRYRRISLIKMERLWYLEEVLGFRQNLDVRDWDIQNKVIFRAHRLIIIVCITLPALLLAIITIIWLIP